MTVSSSLEDYIVFFNFSNWFLILSPPSLAFGELEVEELAGYFAKFHGWHQPNG